MIRTERSTVTNMRTVVDPKMSLSLWLRAGRAAKGMSLEDVAKVTKIQARILERLEAGKLEGLPAEVFVRGFVRSYARCCGLDEAEALQRYAQAASSANGTSAPSGAVARANALVESMSELAPSSASGATRSPRVLTDVQLAAGSLTDVPKQETVVETFLPMTGTLVEEAPAEVAVATAIETPALETAAVETAVVETAAVEPAAEPIVTSAVASPVAGGEETSKKKGRRGGKGRKRKQIAEGTPSSPMMVVPASAAESIVADVAVAHAVVETISTAAVDEPMVADGSTSTTVETIVPATFDSTSDVAQAGEETTTVPAETWSPKMPVVTPSVPWRRPTSTLTTAPKVIVPSIVIDDADPDSAEREIEDRAAAKEPARRSFLPPILLDREDRSARQGGLTLAVIILLIAATLTLSYLMRRPSSTGDGVTQLDGTSQIVA